MDDLLIIGSGPAGMAAAVYAARAELSFAVLERGVSGGQILNTAEVDNYPGITGLSGAELSDAMRKHCDSFGVSFLTKEAVDYRKTEDGFSVILSDGSERETKTILIAAGARPKLLGVPGEDRLRGKGVSYCATCDGFFFRKKDVVVNGGGNTAAEDAIYLARICKSVTLIHRRDRLRADRELVTKLKSFENVRILWDSVVEEIKGETSAASVVLRNVKENTREEIPTNGIFIAIGSEPNNLGWSDRIPCDEHGYIVAGEDGITGVPGIFAAGDVRTKKLRQVITAASDGANAVQSVTDYLRA